MNMQGGDWEIFLQEPPVGPFNRDALHWLSQAAYIPYHRVKDFIHGEENRKGCPTNFFQCEKYKTEQRSLKRTADAETHLEKIRRKKGSVWGHTLDGVQRDPGKDDFPQAEEKCVEEKIRKQDIKKLGREKQRCLCNFEVRRLYLHPSVARLTYECFVHVRSEGVLSQGMIDCTGVASPCSVILSGGNPQVEGGKQRAHPDTFASPVNTQVVSKSEPGFPIYCKKYNEILCIESRLKSMLYNHPGLMVDYYSLLEELEVNLKKALGNKQSSPPVLPSPAADLSSEYGLNAKEALEGNQAVTSIQYPPAPPIRFPNSGAGIDWSEGLARKESSGVPISFPLQYGSVSACDWNMALGGRQSCTSIYIPPAPPVKEIPGGFDWKKALSESQSSISSICLPSTTRNENLGSGYGLRQVPEGPDSSIVTAIPVATPLNINPASGFNWMRGNQRPGQQPVEVLEGWCGSSSEYYRASKPSSTGERNSSHSLVELNSRPRSTGPLVAMSLFRTQSKWRDKREDSSSI